MFDWKPYVPAAKRRQRGARAAALSKAAGKPLTPVTAGRGEIGKTFWGKAWCQNLERYSDYSNRLPRGRTYLRNGSIIHLGIVAGEVEAQVMGSDLYHIKVKISEVRAPHWQSIARDCARSIDSWVELLQGQLSTSVMERITRSGTGLFPSPREITFSCSCPDSAAMCKHVAATLYGIGARLDAEPELLFGLRNVDAKELIAHAEAGGLQVEKGPAAGRVLESSNLADVFGIDLAPITGKPNPPRRTESPKKRMNTAVRKVAKKSAAARSTAPAEATTRQVAPRRRS
jgi:uncharacterized Zn finger protein